jgi:hypothetical protein
MAQTKVKLIADGAVRPDHIHSSVTTDHITEGTKKFYSDSLVSSYLANNSYATTAAGYFTGVTYDTVNNVLTFS